MAVKVFFDRIMRGLAIVFSVLSLAADNRIVCGEVGIALLDGLLFISI